MKFRVDWMKLVNKSSKKLIAEQKSIEKYESGKTTPPLNNIMRLL